MDNKVTLAISDFCVSAAELSKNIGDSKSTLDFCQKVKEQVRSVLVHVRKNCRLCHGRFINR